MSEGHSELTRRKVLAQVRNRIKVPVVLLTENLALLLKLRATPLRVVVFHCNDPLKPPLSVWLRGHKIFSIWLRCNGNIQIERRSAHRIVVPCCVRSGALGCCLERS